MKKHLLFKKMILTSVALMTVLSCKSLMAQSEHTNIPEYSSGNVPRVLTSDKVIEVTVTPDGIQGDQHAISIGRGDVLTIRGKVSDVGNEDISPLDPNNLNQPAADQSAASTLEYVSLNLGRTKNILHNPVSITTADKQHSVKINGEDIKQDGTFEFQITGDHKGEQRIAVKAGWSANGERTDSKYPIIVTVR